MRRIFGWIVLCSAIAVLESSSLERDDPNFGERPIELSLRRVRMDGLRVARGFRKIGAWEVRSPDAGFGGISAMAFDHGLLVMVSDTGSVITVRPQFARRRAKGTIAGIGKACGHDGQKTSRDSESLAIDPESGVRWIGFEGRNVICRIDPARPNDARIVAPPAMRAWPNTGGAEAMTRLCDGQFMAIAERPRGDKRNSPVVIFDRDPTDPAAVARTSLFVPPNGFRPTDIVEMPDGSLAILTRSYQPPFAFDGRLVTIARGALDTRKISGKTVVQFTRPLDENFEALAVTQSNGRAYIWIMSDDNFMPFQRTMLVLLEVIG